MNGIFNHLWQSTVFAAAVALAAVGLRRNSPRLRYWLWLTASVKFLVPFSLIISTGARIQLPPATPSLNPAAVQQITTYFEPVATPSASPSAHAAFPWFRLALAVWLTGVIFLVSRLFLEWRTIHRAARRAKRLPLPLPVPALSSPLMMEPGVFGLFRPVLLLPEGIAENITPGQFEAIIVHELRHIRYRDNLIASLHIGVEALFWFHPVVWWIGAMLMKERELDCDEAVLEQGAEPADYARTIVEVCRIYVESPLPCSPGISGSDLKKRIRGIMTWRGSLPMTFRAKATLAAAAIAAVAAPFIIGMLRAQTIESPGFEVASVKPSPPVSSRRIYFPPPRGGPGTSDPGQITWSYALMKTLIMTAYNVTAYQVSGPAWLDTERYDIVAKVPAGAIREQVPAMWRNLLAERFGLRAHHESKEFQVENLVIAKGGAKLKETGDPNAALPPGPPELKNGELQTPGMVHRIAPGANGTATDSVLARGQPISQLATMLGNTIHRPVVDKTGLIGKYDFSLDFSLDLLNGAGPGTAPPGDTASEPLPEVSDAIQRQLGLWLVPGKATLDVVVIDKVEKVPTAN